MVKCFTVSPMRVNMYLYYDEIALKGILIDPCANVEKVKIFAIENKIEIIGVVLTHGHFDHIADAEKAKEMFNVPIYAGINEASMLGNSDYNLSLKSMGVSIEFEADKYLKDGDVLEIGNKKIEILETAGHTLGGIVIHAKSDNIAFVGDTIFRESVGNTTFPLGDYNELKKSILNKIFTLPDNTELYCGHGLNTTVIYEKENNPYMQGESCIL